MFDRTIKVNSRCVDAPRMFPSKPLFSWMTAGTAALALALPSMASAAETESAAPAAAAYESAAPENATARVDVVTSGQAGVVVDNGPGAPLVITPEKGVAASSKDVVDDLAVFEGQDGSTVVEATSQGVRLASVLGEGATQSAETTVSYSFKGATLELSPRVQDPISNTLLEQDGSVMVRDSSGAIVARIHEPWATDDSGTKLPTHYRIDGSTLTQVIDTNDATGTVVADPYLDFNWTHVKVMTSRRERESLWHQKYYGAAAATIGTYACDAAGVYKYPCKVAIVGSAAYLFSTLDASRRAQDCFYVYLPYQVPAFGFPHLGHTKDNCRY